MSHEFDDQIRDLPRFRLPEEVKERQLRMISELAEDRHVPTPRSHGRPTRRRAVLIAGIAVVTAGAGVGTAAALGLLSAKPTDRRFASCYATDDVHSTTNHLDITVATPSGADPTEKDAANSALDICTGAWQQGRLSSTDPHVKEDPEPPPWNRKVPPLIACVLPSGQVGIFPGTEPSCQQMGLPAAEM